jgi:hypothetical protein
MSRSPSPPRQRAWCITHIASLMSTARHVKHQPQTSHITSVISIARVLDHHNSHHDRVGRTQLSPRSRLLHTTLTTIAFAAHTSHHDRVGCTQLTPRSRWLHTTLTTIASLHTAVRCAGPPGAQRRGGRGCRVSRVACSLTRVWRSASRQRRHAVWLVREHNDKQTNKQTSKQKTYKQLRKQQSECGCSHTYTTRVVVRRAVAGDLRHNTLSTRCSLSSLKSNTECLRVNVQAVPLGKKMSVM